MSSSDGTIQLGHGFSFRFFTESGMSQPTGIIIYGPAGPNCKHRGISAGGNTENNCGGGLHFDNSTIAKKESRPMWTRISLDPLEISPSILCSCGDQHGFIRGGVYLPC